MKKAFDTIGLAFTIVFGFEAHSQNSFKDLRFNLNEEGTQYLKMNLTTQVWARYTELNPGSTLSGFEEGSKTDLGLRRVRTQLFGKVNERVFMYTQFGINSFTSISARKPGIFWHDVAAEYYATSKSVHIGMGLCGWTGMSRFSSPSVASILGYDAPLFEQSTNDVTDQFLRKLSIYAKGIVGKLNYRVVVSDPMLARNSSQVQALNVVSDFSYKAPQPQAGGYFMYHFMDEESNLTPYTTGTYLGKKRVFNVGAGFQFQSRAMWHLSDTIKKDTLYSDMSNVAIDVYYDCPVGSDGAAFSFYGIVSSLDFGKNYIRNFGIMNPADGMKKGTDNFNGQGNNVPLYGTGNVVFVQAGYLLPKTISVRGGQFMPYVMYMRASYHALSDPMQLLDAGLNWYISEHRAKITINYQNRPVYRISNMKEAERKAMIVLQFQIAI